jgi:hypothetical protein
MGPPARTNGKIAPPEQVGGVSALANPPVRSVAETVIPKGAAARTPKKLTLPETVAEVRPSAKEPLQPVANNRITPERIALPPKKAAPSVADAAPTKRAITPPEPVDQVTPPAKPPLAPVPANVPAPSTTKAAARPEASLNQPRKSVANGSDPAEANNKAASVAEGNNVASTKNKERVSLPAKKPPPVPEAVANNVAPAKKKAAAKEASKNRFVWVPEAESAPPQTPVAVPEPAPEDAEEDEDDTYIAFIASSIHGDGVQLKERAEVPDLVPIAPAVVKDRVDASPEFWQELEMLEVVLRGTNQIGFEGQVPRCRKCDKKFASVSKLLRHCWARHREALNEFALA